MVKVEMMRVQLTNGENIEIEDPGMYFCSCFSLVGDSRIIGLIQGIDGKKAICVWRQVGDLWKHHFTISLDIDADGDDLLTIATHNHVMVELGRPPLEKTMDLIVVS